MHEIFRVQIRVESVFVFVVSLLYDVKLSLFVVFAVVLCRLVLNKKNTICMVSNCLIREIWIAHVLKKILNWSHSATVRGTDRHREKRIRKNVNFNHKLKIGLCLLFMFVFYVWSMYDFRGSKFPLSSNCLYLTNFLFW